MKKQNTPSGKAYVVRGALYLFLFLCAFVIPLALGQRNAPDAAIEPKKSSFAVGHATGEPAEAQPTPVAAATAIVVWEQYDNAGTAVTLSATFTDAPAMNSDLADDFVVQDYAWMVRWIDVDGAYFNGPGPADSFTVVFYADNDGFPGNQVYATLAWWEQNGSTFRVHVCDNPPCQPILYPGKYWIEIQANMTAMCCGEWGWTDRTVTDLDPAVWRNPGGFLGTCTSWSRRAATCGLDSSAPDQVYRIYANVIPTPTATATTTPTTTSTPTPPPPTATPSEPPCEVTGSQPACNSIVSMGVTDFVVYVSYFLFDSVPPSAFTVNGIPADTAAVGGSLINFHFNTSPLVQGGNTMHIPRGAFSCINGHTVDEFMCTFTYQPPRSTPVPRPRATPAPRPTP